MRATKSEPDIPVQEPTKRSLKVFLSFIDRRPGAGPWGAGRLHGLSLAVEILAGISYEEHGRHRRREADDRPQPRDEGPCRRQDASRRTDDRAEFRKQHHPRYGRQDPGQGDCVQLRRARDRRARPRFTRPRRDAASRSQAPGRYRRFPPSTPFPSSRKATNIWASSRSVSRAPNCWRRCATI